MPPTTDQYHILVLGSSFAALKTSHAIFKSAASSNTNIHITMLSASTHFWWIVGAPRAMFTGYPDDNTSSFLPVEPAFAKHKEAGKYTFIQGKVTNVDTDKKTVRYSPVHNETDGNPLSSRLSADAAFHDISYDSIIVATGSRGSDSLFSYHDTHIPSIQRYAHIQQNIAGVSNILIVGGGAAGVETAGEVGYLNMSERWGKNVTLLTGASRCLPELPEKVGKTAQGYLEDMNVKVIHNVLIESNEQGDHEKIFAKLSNGESMKVEILIQATGRKAVSEFMSSGFVDPKSKQIRVDEKNRIKGAKNAYAVGDVCSTSNMGLMAVMMGHGVVAENVLAEVKNGGREIELEKLKSFKAILPNTQFVPVGPQKGVGCLLGWQLPSLMVWGIKGRNLMFPMIGGYLNG